MRYYILTLLLSVNAFALETGDRMKSRIVKAYKKNILVINRGLEDAVNKGEHMKLTNENGFIARGICLKSTMQTSHWKIYRVVRPHLVSYDDRYWLNAINQSEIPPSLMKYKEVDIARFLKYGDKDANKALRLQKKRIAEYDLPDNLTSDDFFMVPEDKRWEYFVKRNFDGEQFDKDNKLYKGRFDISPISNDSFASAQVNDFSLKLESVSKKYNTSMLYDIVNND
jgi:hypothetical protein